MKVPGDNTVASKISGMDAKPVRAAQGVGAIRRHDQAPGQQSATAAQSDNVSLTGASRDLASIQQSLMSMPAVDEARVANVKRRLESGQYRVDAQRVADRLLHLESDLARRSPVERSALK
jgi:negative regulator of flagellin synthesis FlgM